MRTVYEVKYKTAWAGDFIEPANKNVIAKNAEQAIAKTKTLVGKESYKQDGKTFKRVHFELVSVVRLCDVDG